MKKNIFKIIVFVAVVVGAFVLARSIIDNETVKNLITDYGYPGLFIASVISGFNILVPIPIVSFLPVLLEAGLNYVLVILIISIGVTSGDMLAYLVGLAGRGISEEAIKSRMQKLEKLSEKHPVAPLIVLFFFAAFVPFPNEVIVIPLAFLGYKARSILPVALAGNLVFNFLASQGFIGLYDLIF